MLNIIVVEDHEALREITVEALRSQGHNVAGVDSAEALQDDAAHACADVMVIDLNLPGEDGISLSRRLRRDRPGLGIIMVTARTQLPERIEGYASGADLYLTKPTSVEELGAAVQALGRRLNHGAHQQSVLRFDLMALQLHGPAGQLGLTSQQGALLAAFARAPGQQLENAQLLELMSKGEAKYRKASLEVQIVRLRKLLVKVGAGEQPIKAIRHLGYQLCVRVAMS